MSNKLYTENQVEEMLMKARYHNRDESEMYTNEYLIAQHTPIELPSDEEIEQYINSTPYYGTCTPEYCEGIEDGIKYVINKIQGGNK